MNSEAQPKLASSSASGASISFAPHPATATATAADATPRARSKHSRTISNVSRRRAARPSSQEFLSDRATAQLVRRVLCPQQAPDRGRVTPAPIDELLPPLTSRNDVDLQLYALIAIVLRDFVQTWYNKITPDEAFVAEIVQIIAHCTRALEQRLRKVDVESLLFDELPDLFDKHVQAYRASHQLLVRPPIGVDAREVYHSLCPLPYLSPIPRPEKPTAVSEQAENEVAYRQLLVQGVLAVLLPTEDLENGCLTSLVGQILSELIIGGVVVKKASEPWMIWTGLTILADVIRQRRRGPPASESQPTGGRGRSIPMFFWSFVHYIFAFMAFIRVFVTTLAMSRYLPSRRHPLPAHKDDQSQSDVLSARTNADPAQPDSVSVNTPVLAFSIWSTVSNLVRMDLHMPWLLGGMSMLQWLAIAGPGHAAGSDGIVDRILSDAIHRSVLDPANLPLALRNLRGALFPNNAMGTQTIFPPESDQELRAVKRKCAIALWTLVPRSVGRLYFGGSASSWLAAWFANPGDPLSSTPRRSCPTHPNDNDNSSGGGDLKGDPDAHVITEIETDVLDIFSDVYCNKHLMYSALELVLVRLMPELAEKGVMELWGERLS